MINIRLYYNNSKFGCDRFSLKIHYFVYDCMVVSNMVNCDCINIIFEIMLVDVV